MSFQHVQNNPEDLDSTIDEDSTLSCQVTRLGTIQYRKLWEDATKSLTDSAIRKYESSELVRSAPFDQRSSVISTTIKSELTEIKSLCFADVLEIRQFAKSDPSIMKLKPHCKSALKSTEKSKYLKWHAYMADRRKRGISMQATLKAENGLVAPYFIFGDEKACDKWDHTRWQEEEEWWEDDQWNSDSPTYSRFNEDHDSPRQGFGSYVHYLEGKGS